MKNIKIKTPSNWRLGQTFFNFFEWLAQRGIIGNGQSERMGDPFHLSDEEFEKYYEEFLKDNK